MLDSRERFTATADDYERHRPDYPPALFEWLLAATGVEPGAPVLDIGCGTGISTRLLAGCGLSATGIDPNPAMLARAERAGGARYLMGEAAATGLPDASQALVTAAQALHWFADEPSFDEFARILRPGGWCAAWWNVRLASNPLEAGYDALLREHCPDYPGISHRAELLARLERHPRVRRWNATRLTHGQRLDAEGLRGRARSSSYVAHGVADRRAFDAALDRLFEAHQRDGWVHFRFEILAACWQLAP